MCLYSIFFFFFIHLHIVEGSLFYCNKKIILCLSLVFSFNRKTFKIFMKTFLHYLNVYGAFSFSPFQYISRVEQPKLDLFILIFSLEHGT